jgi:hypothetical protein
MRRRKLLVVLAGLAVVVAVGPALAVARAGHAGELRAHPRRDDAVGSRGNPRLGIR